jgi:hypothetical protein
MMIIDNWRMIYMAKKTTRQYYQKARDILKTQDAEIKSARDTYAEIEKQPYEKSYKQQKRKERDQAEQMARDKASKSIDKLREAYRQHVLEETIPDASALDINLVRLLSVTELSPDEYAMMGKKYRDAGDTTSCRLLYEDAKKHGIVLKGVYTPAADAIKDFDAFCSLVGEVCADEDDGIERLAGETALDDMIDAVSAFADAPIEAFPESEELSRELQAQHKELTAKMNADFLRGFSGDDAVDREARTEAASIADITKWKLRDDDDSGNDSDHSSGDAGQGGSAEVRNSPL